MGKPQDLTNRRYGRLLVKEKTTVRRNNRICWLCLCDCGKETIVRGNSLCTGSTTSCGCRKQETAHQNCYAQQLPKHGQSRTLGYRIWYNMLQRCLPTHPAHAYYYDKGIRVCSRWANSLPAFLQDMGPIPPSHPEQGHYTLDRLNNDKDYEPSNCRWATFREQGNNTCRNRRLTFRGEIKTLAEWSRVTGLSQDCLWMRLSRGWSIEATLTRPHR